MYRSTLAHKPCDSNKSSIYNLAYGKKCHDKAFRLVCVLSYCLAILSALRTSTAFLLVERSLSKKKKMKKCAVIAQYDFVNDCLKHVRRKANMGIAEALLARLLALERLHRCNTTSHGVRQECMQRSGHLSRVQCELQYCGGCRRRRRLVCTLLESEACHRSYGTCLFSRRRTIASNAPTKCVASEGS